MSWYGAYCAILGGNEALLGPRGKKMKACAYLALFFLFVPFFVASKQYQYSGQRPPEAPLIRSVGTLNYVPAKFPANRHPEHLEFKTDKGLVYQVDYGRGPTVVYDLVASGPALIYDLVKPGRPECPGVVGDPGCPRTVYMEGFLLRDGKGPLWPTYVASEERTTLVSREQLDEILGRVGRSGYEIGYIMFPFSLLFAGITMVNAYFVRKRYSEVIQSYGNSRN